MSRPLRIEYPRAIYHVMCRGNAGQRIFHDPETAYRRYVEPGLTAPPRIPFSMPFRMAAGQFGLRREGSGQVGKDDITMDTGGCAFRSRFGQNSTAVAARYGVDPQTFLNRRAKSISQTSPHGCHAN